MSSTVMTLDVREDIRSGREPFSKIMDTVAGLAPGCGLRLVAPFRPAPLIPILAEKGFSCHASQTEEGDWEVLFTPVGPGIAESRPEREPKQPHDCSGPPVIEVDARNLEPPEPLVRILESVSALPSGCRLRARTDRRPMHLYSHLEERGFTADSTEQPDGSFVTFITHAKR